MELDIPDLVGELILANFVMGDEALDDCVAFFGKLVELRVSFNVTIDVDEICLFVEAETIPYPDTDEVVFLFDTEDVLTVTPDKDGCFVVIIVMKCFVGLVSIGEVLLSVLVVDRDPELLGLPFEVTDGVIVDLGKEVPVLAGVLLVLDLAKVAVGGNFIDVAIDVLVEDEPLPEVFINFKEVDNDASDDPCIFGVEVVCGLSEDEDPPLIELELIPIIDDIDVFPEVLVCGLVEDRVDGTSDVANVALEEMFVAAFVDDCCVDVEADLIEVIWKVCKENQSSSFYAKIV